jgi:hypothetical protein
LELTSLKMAFRTEKRLVEEAANRLPLRDWVASGRNTRLYQGREVRGLFGVPDLVVAAVQGRGSEVQFRSIAFEMKLSDWRRGLAQAFRYRAFAGRVFLVLDQAHVEPALANSARFVRAKVGLIGLDCRGGFTIYHQPSDESPYSERLSRSFEQFVYAQVRGRKRRPNAPSLSNPGHLAMISAAS